MLVMYSSTGSTGILSNIEEGYTVDKLYSHKSSLFKSILNIDFFALENYGNEKLSNYSPLLKIRRFLLSL